MKSLLSLCIFTISLMATAQGRFDNVQIKVEPVGDDIYMLVGAGGNIGISVGEDGVFMIDDQFAPLSDKIMAAIKTVSDKPVKFLVNTHFHGDHSGGNANFEAAGAMIVAHDNVRKRLAENEKTADAGLPVITFSEDATFYMNGNDIFITHVHEAHTDGDALIYFAQSNVLHTGDTFFNGRFPYIDLARGGSITGDIAAAAKGLMLINDETKIIPGHGPMGTKEDYKKYNTMLKTVAGNISDAIQAGKTEDQVVADGSLTNDFFTDEETKDDFISGEKFRRTIYQSLIKEKETNIIED
ncbi:MBL fold metallo-hydrolase [Dokdonia sinensis]|uniref:MBL fold metallo-hydrolase n=1 Tax=Dokdonia sinensis TaxID=2479847 RepID=A0A3M0G3Q7_9FLAO|nr:MBL fold metallo-hydrolase [Dokdonia sinensis]RMB56523.1 MBL fold metallo-hydrolase [Dokdonia sinensis]